jgi:hypothetical protein
LSATKIALITNGIQYGSVRVNMPIVTKYTAKLKKIRRAAMLLFYILNCSTLMKVAYGSSFYNYTQRQNLT